MGRMEKINEMMRRELSEIIHQDIHDPRVEFVTITNVAVSPDLRHARVSYSVLGDEKKVSEAGTCLNNARGYIRKLIGQRVEIRFTPEFDFVYDKSLVYSARIEKALQEIKEARKTAPGGQDDGMENGLDGMKG